MYYCLQGYDTVRACEVYFKTLYAALRSVDDWISGDNLKGFGRGLVNVLR
jgi:hypothetical protein